MDVETFVGKYIIANKESTQQVPYFHEMFNQLGGIQISQDLFSHRFALFTKKKEIERSSRGGYWAKIYDSQETAPLEFQSNYPSKGRKRPSIDVAPTDCGPYIDADGEETILGVEMEEEEEDVISYDSEEEESIEDTPEPISDAEENKVIQDNLESSIGLNSSEETAPIDIEIEPEIRATDCEGSPLFITTTEERIFYALAALSFDVDLLKKYDFAIYCLSYKPVQYRGFLETNDVDQYLSLGNRNAIVISLDVPKIQEFFVCAIVAEDSSTIRKAPDFANILATISRHFKPIRRGGTHKQEGTMYPYGFHGCRTRTDFETYVREKKSFDDANSWEVFEDHMEAIFSHYSATMKRYFPSLVSKYMDMLSKYHSPCIGDSYAGTFFTAFNFASAVHKDVFDATYAFGVWYDRGIGISASNAFVFPQFRVAIQIHHGLCALWNSEKALHCTVRSPPHSKTRIGTVVQMNKSLNTKALKLWQSQNNIE